MAGSPLQLLLPAILQEAGESLSELVLKCTQSPAVKLLEDSLLAMTHQDSPLKMTGLVLLQNW